MKKMEASKNQSELELFNGNCFDFLRTLPTDSVDLTITSPPYFMGKEYDRSQKIEDFVSDLSKILPEIHRVTKIGGSICWQVGYHIKNGVLVPLDFLTHSVFNNFNDFFLRNRIVWSFGHGLHSKKRFSGRHEVILWYTKGMDYYFDLDSVRIPQKYPGKKYYKGSRKGEYSGNPSGKNPTDIWEIPNVKANHIEKTQHPCQYPVALVQRLIKALSPIGGTVLDPYMGSGSTGVAAILEGREFLGSELDKKYFNIARGRCQASLQGNIKIRPLDKQIFIPNSNMSVAKNPFI